MEVGYLFGKVDSSDWKRIVQGQVQGPSPINKHQVLPLAGATLAEFHQVFDGRIMQAGDGLDHGPYSRLQRARAPLGSTCVPPLCGMVISMLVRKPRWFPSISARRWARTKGVTPGVWALSRTHSGSSLSTWLQRSRSVGKSRSSFQTSPLLPRPN